MVTSIIRKSEGVFLGIDQSHVFVISVCNPNSGSRTKKYVIFPYLQERSEEI